MYRLKENKMDDFLYTGSWLMNKEGNTFEYVAKNNQLYILRNMETGEMERFTYCELRQMYGKKPVYYYCEFSHGENLCTCEEWQEAGSQRYLQLPAWESVAGAMDWLKWDEMEEEEKNSIFIKLWRSDHVLVGIFDAEELEKISYGEYEPWEE